MTEPFNWRDIQSLVEIGLILVIVWLDYLMLQDGRANRKLYEAFFQERTKWYAARSRKKPLPSGTPTSPEVVLLDEVVRQEQQEGSEDS